MNHKRNCCLTDEMRQCLLKRKLQTTAWHVPVFKLVCGYQKENTFSDQCSWVTVFTIYGNTTHNCDTVGCFIMMPYWLYSVSCFFLFVCFAASGWNAVNQKPKRNIKQQKLIHQTASGKTRFNKVKLKQIEKGASEQDSSCVELIIS